MTDSLNNVSIFSYLPEGASIHPIHQPFNTIHPSHPPTHQHHPSILFTHPIHPLINTIHPSYSPIPSTHSSTPSIHLIHPSHPPTHQHHPSISSTHPSTHSSTPSIHPIHPPINPIHFSIFLFFRTFLYLPILSYSSSLIQPLHPPSIFHPFLVTHSSFHPFIHISPSILHSFVNPLFITFLIPAFIFCTPLSLIHPVKDSNRGQQLICLAGINLPGRVTRMHRLRCGAV